MRWTTHVPTVIVTACIIAALWLLLTVDRMADSVDAASPGPPPATTPSHVRVGTYDSRAIACAYAPSKQHERVLQQLTGEAQRAKEAKDDKRLAELKAQGAARQRRMHLQGFSTAPVDDILDQVRDQLPDVAHKAGVVAIARSTDFHDPAAVETVDVTDELVALFEPTERTLRAIASAREREPIAIEVISKMDAHD
jgi:hypothetical protein